MINIIDDLDQRGLIADSTGRDNLQQILENPINFYCGFDPTATSLHLGNLLPIILMKRLQNEGHRPIVLVGGATGGIGDPSGKDKERNMLNNQEILQNCEAIQQQLSTFIDFEGNNAAKLVNNADWLGEFSLMSWLRDVGKHINITQMIAKDSVKQRLSSESGISYTEFSYQLLQAYDFYHLSIRNNCLLQVGGSDQWGNMTAGIQLTRKLEKKEVHALTHPLITTADGKKFGKSEGNAIWLDERKTSAFELYQYLLNLSDDDIEKMLLMFSFHSVSDIKSLIAEHQKTPEKRLAQHHLAYELVELVHSKEKATSAQRNSTAMFTGDYKALSSDELVSCFKGCETIRINSGELIEGKKLTELLITSKLAASSNKAKTLIAQGGIAINEEKITDVDYIVTVDDLLPTSGDLTLKRGKKTYALVQVFTQATAQIIRHAFS